MKDEENRQQASGVDEEDVTDLYDAIRGLREEVESIRKQMYFLNKNIEDLVDVVK